MPAGPLELTDDEQAVFQAVTAVEATTGTPGSILDIARRAGRSPEQVRVVMGRLTDDLGLVSEVPGDPVDDPRYSASGRAGAGGGAGDALDRLPAELTELIGDDAFPARAPEVASQVDGRGASRELRLALEELADDVTYLNLEQLTEALRAELR